MPAHITLLYRIKSPDEIDAVYSTPCVIASYVFQRSSFLLGGSIGSLVKPYICPPSRNTHSEN